MDNPLVAYDEALAGRIRALLRHEPGLSEKRMFGGLAFLIHGNMAVSASGRGGMMLRCDPAATAALVRDGTAHRMVMRGREMDGWLRVDPGAIESQHDLKRWVERGAAYARSLPPKQ